MSVPIHRLTVVYDYGAFKLARCGAEHYAVSEGQPAFCLAADSPADAVRQGVAALVSYQRLTADEAATALAAQAAQIKRLTADLATARADALGEAIAIALNDAAVAADDTATHGPSRYGDAWEKTARRIATALNNLKDRTDDA